MHATSPELAARLTRISRFIAWSTIFIGGSTLVGWMTGSVALQTWVMSPITMKAMTAAGFVFVGVAFLLLHPETGKEAWRAWIGHGLAAVVAILGFLSALQYVFDVSLGIDNLLIQETLGPFSGQYPGRMAALTAVGFLCLGGSLFGLRSRGSRWVPHTLLAVLTGLIGVMGIEDVLLDPQGNHMGMASHTALAFFLMGFGLLFARPQDGLMRLVTAPGASGNLARRLLPVTIAVPLILTWLGRAGEMRGWYDSVVEASVMAAVRIVVLGTLILWALRSAQQMETARELAEHGVRRANRSLDALSQANEAVVRAGDEQELLEAVCRIVVETGGYKLAWVGVPEQDKDKTVRMVAFAGQGDQYVAAASITWADNELGRGPTGTAIRTKRPQVARDIDTEPAFQPWRAAARQHGLASSIALPLLDEEEVLGVLNIYAVKPDAFDTQEVDLLSRLAANLAYGVAALRAGQRREQAEQALQRSEQRHRSLVLATAQMVWSTDPDGQVRQPIPGWQKFTGQTDAEVMGDGWTTALHPDDVERTRMAWANALTTGTVYEAEHHIRRLDGTYRYFAVRGVPVLAEDHSIREWICTCTDITEQRELEEGLRESQAYNRGLLESSIDGLVTVDRALVVTDVNQAMCRMAGKPREEIIGSLFPAYFIEAARAEQGVRQTFEQGAVTDYVLTLRAAGGRDIAVSLNAAVFRNDAGEVQGILAAARDITARQKLEQELREAQAYNRGLIESSVDGIVTVDHFDRVTDVNQTMSRMTGKTRDEILGSAFSSYFTEPSRAEGGIRQTFAQGSVTDYQLLLRTAEEREIPVSFSASVFRDAVGEVQGIFAAARDITERRRAEESLERYAEQLKRSNQELEDFATVASHDLQEPLRKIGAFGERLSQRCCACADPQARDYLARMMNASRRMSELINSLLEFSRVARKCREFEPTDLNQVAAEVVSDLESRIEESGAEVTIGPLPSLLADPIQIRQLLQNLIANALKFRKQAGSHRVVVTSRQENGFWEIHVTDNGIGFDVRFLDRIFKPFQKLHGRGEYEGYGMGLAVCDKIVRRHGGQLTAHSQPGQGSDFIMILPGLPSQEGLWTDNQKVEDTRTSSSLWPKTMTTISR